MPEMKYEDGPTVLFKHVEQRDWKGVNFRSSHHPAEAITWVTKSNPVGYRSLPLHEACMRRPPATVIMSLLKAYPDSIKETMDGDLPLHIAIKYGAQKQTINALSSTYPESRDMKDRLGVSCSDLLQQRKEALYKILEKADESQKEMGDKAEKMLNDLIADFSKATLEKSESIESFESADSLPSWQSNGLAIVVVGASGDLAKKKTYPSLLALHADNFLPKNTVIWGFARSNLSHEDLRARLKPFLLKKHDEKIVDSFLAICYYQKGTGYGDQEAFASLNTQLLKHEAADDEKFHKTHTHNRLFYFAIPPNVFAETGLAIKNNAMAPRGWSRMIVEKPFGRDLESCRTLLKTLDEYFTEDQLYRIDHYLGKEIVQNLLIMRFANRIFENMWSNRHIESVFLTFKEPFGTQGRGGYFDKYGIIRDIIQNHLIQVMCLVAMEAPIRASGPGSSSDVRDEKVKVLKSISPVTLDDVYLGQYEGYTDDETIENKDSNTPTFAAVKLHVNTPRWQGVPFILKAGKALNERKAEIRIQFKDAPAADFMFYGDVPRNELVMRMQPNEAIYMKTNFKSPGFSSSPLQGELEVNYDTRFFHNESGTSNPEAYTRLILNVIQGRQAAFVRDDELMRSWEIFTPILHKIETENIRPFPYKEGSRGPEGADPWILEKSGYIRNKAYKFYK